MFVFLVACVCFVNENLLKEKVLKKHALQQPLAASSQTDVCNIVEHLWR